MPRETETRAGIPGTGLECLSGDLGKGDYLYDMPRKLGNSLVIWCESARSFLK